MLVNREAVSYPYAATIPFGSVNEVLRFALS
jgi:hypothetical protein